ncbi:MATE family efflux transporter [Harryflintia acetispora]|uniref:MATE family efflux protein n=1 Tax=Harryflintia acetispora TaxID=1849041 RepID=A0A9X8UIW2_9FIRM|nr:MATE family efflux transporter [Harryflintia acetispora]TCL43300.1 putative MATE family efflux protein [Harryflintia acetispora]
MNSNEILHGNITKTFFKYVSANVFSMIAMSVYFLADTFFVANGVGAQGLVALNLALPAYGLISGVGLMIGTGGATLYAISLGAGEREQGNRLFTQSLVISVAFGFLYMIAMLALLDPFCRMLGASGEVLPMTKEYVRTILFFSCAFIADNIVCNFVRNDGAPRLASIALVVGSLANIVLDYVFIFPLGLGMFGAALATGTSPVISVLICSIHFLRGKNNFKLERCRFSPRQLGRIIITGFPAFVNEMSISTVILVFNMMILRLAGDIGVAAYGIVQNIVTVCNAIFTGIGQGAQPVISQNYGARNQARVKKALRLACSFALIVGAAVYLCCALFARPLAGAFNQAGTPGLTELTMRGMRLYFLAFFFLGLNIVFTLFFASISRPKPSLALSVLRGYIAILPTVLILPRALGLDGVWLSSPVAEAITLLVASICVLRFFKGDPEMNAPESDEEYRFVPYSRRHLKECAEIVAQTWDFTEGFCGLRRPGLLYEYYVRDCVIPSEHTDVILDREGHVMGLLFGGNEKASPMTRLCWKLKNRWMRFTRWLHLCLGHFGGRKAALAALRGLKEHDRMGEDTDEEFDSEINLFILSPEVRGKGLGKQLMDRYIDFCKGRGLHSSFLWTTTNCTYSFYERYGYQLYRNNQGALGNGEDLMIYYLRY